MNLFRPLAASFRLARCTCTPLRLQLLARPALLPSHRSYAKKVKHSSSARAEPREEPEEAYSKQKKGKGKGKSFATEDDVDSSVGKFDLAAIETSMEESIDKLRVGLKSVVGRVGRVSPDLLDGIKVEVDGKRHPLAEFATVSVKDGKELLVTVYEEDSLKAVSAALYASPLSLTPQPVSSTALRIPIPRPDHNKRQTLVRQASELCESARVNVRSVRGRGQKEIKSDVDSKVVGKEEGRSDSKALDSSTKIRTDEIDAIFERAKKVLMEE